jgi:broad specificity phosphatase PhoE
MPSDGPISPANGTRTHTRYSGSGQSLIELRERGSCFLKDLQDKRILCISDGMVIRMMDALLKGKSPADWRAVIHNCHASIFNLDL